MEIFCYLCLRCWGSEAGAPPLPAARCRGAEGRLCEGHSWGRILMSHRHSSRLTPAAREAQVPIVLCQVFHNFSPSLSRGNVVASSARSPSGWGCYVSTARAHGPPSASLRGRGTWRRRLQPRCQQRGLPHAPTPALEVELASVTCPPVHDATPGPGKAFASRNARSAVDPGCDCARQEPCLFVCLFVSYSSFLK